MKCILNLLFDPSVTVLKKKRKREETEKLLRLIKLENSSSPYVLESLTDLLHF